MCDRPLSFLSFIQIYFGAFAAPTFGQFCVKCFCVLSQFYFTWLSPGGFHLDKTFLWRLNEKVSIQIHRAYNLNAIYRMFNTEKKTYWKYTCNDWCRFTSIDMKCNEWYFICSVYISCVWVLNTQNHQKISVR